MKFQSSVPSDERCPFRLRLLNAVFTEYALTGGYDGLDRVRLEGLRYGDERNASRIAPRLAASPRDFLAHAKQSVPSIYAFHIVNNRGDS
jgi:hypothetical protein